MPSVDIAFPLRAAATVPRDHGYALYGALSRMQACLHETTWLGVHPLPGKPEGDFLVVAAGSHLRLRVPDSEIATLLPLTGARLEIGGSVLQLDVPRVYQLAPAASLDARTVFIKLTKPPRRASDEGRETLDNQGLADRYAAEIRRQLDAMNVGGVFELRGRRTITVRGRRLVGFSVRVGELTVDESLVVQERGLGGKRAMGCGIFRPTRRRAVGG